MPVLVERLGALSLGSTLRVCDHHSCSGAAQGGCENSSDGTGGDPALPGGAGAPDRPSGAELHSCPGLVRPCNYNPPSSLLFLCSSHS